MQRTHESLFNCGEEQRLQKRTASLANLQLRGKFAMGRKEFASDNPRVSAFSSHEREPLRVHRAGAIAGERAERGWTLTTPNTQRHYSQPCMPTARQIQCERRCWPGRASRTDMALLACQRGNAREQC